MVQNPTLQQLVATANLDEPLSNNCLNLVSKVEVTKNYAELRTHKAFYFLAKPPSGNGVKANIIFLHDQTNSAVVWVDCDILQTFAAFGYNCIALDLPGMGRTGGASVEEADRPGFLCEFVESLGLREVIIVGSSQAGQYIIPLLAEPPPKFFITCVIAIALSDTNKLSPDTAGQITTPCLVIRGSQDTSLGLNSENNLRHLLNGRLEIIPEAKHLCHRSNPLYFNRIALNFLDLVLKNVIQKSTFVTNL